MYLRDIALNFIIFFGNSNIYELFTLKYVLFFSKKMNLLNSFSMFLSYICVIS